MWWRDDWTGEIWNLEFSGLLYVTDDINQHSSSRACHKLFVSTLWAYRDQNDSRCVACSICLRLSGWSFLAKSETPVAKHAQVRDTDLCYLNTNVISELCNSVKDTYEHQAPHRHLPLSVWSSSWRQHVWKTKAEPSDQWVNEHSQHSQDSHSRQGKEQTTKNYNYNATVKWLIVSRLVWIGR